MQGQVPLEAAALDQARPFSVMLLDGGLGHVLKTRDLSALAPGLSFDSQFAAAALANEAAPDMVAAVHREYIDAGADIITANSFGCTAWSLGRIGRAEAAPMLAAAGAKLAKACADAAPRPVCVAGSLPPLGPSYGKSALSLEAMAAEYGALAAALAPACDVLLCETLSSVDEAAAAAKAAAAAMPCRPVWVSWTLADCSADESRPHLRSGESLEAAVASVATLTGVQQLLVNCSSPDTVLAGVRVLRTLAPAGMGVGGYANGFRTTTLEWMAGTTSPSLTNPADYADDGGMRPAAYAAHAAGWAAAGAVVVGGCCGVGPEHIRAVDAELRRHGWR